MRRIGFLFLLVVLNINLILAQNTKLQITETTYEGKPHFVIKTKEITWYFDREGGGFSRMIDRDGNDWITFKREPWGIYPESAASAFRGIPNLVFKSDDGGAGHPGHEKCVSRLEGDKIVTESKSGKWKWSWTFSDDHALLEILQTDPAQPYWFLYEGTPGGKYSPGNYYFGTSAGGPETQLPDFWKGQITTENFNWMYAGSLTSNRTFYMLQLSPDDKTDMVSFLGNTKEGVESPDGMTVFGFGRDDKGNPLLTGNHQFVVGFYPEKVSKMKQHQAFSGYLEKQFLVNENQDLKRTKPQSEGIDNAKLLKALDFLKSKSFADGIGEVVIIRNNHIVYEGENVNNQHNIYSCTKVFTSTVLGLLIDEKKVNLDDFAAKYDPVLKELYPEVTFRHFATMTSGYSAAGRSRWENKNADWSWTPYTPETPHFSPGTHFEYWDEAQMMFAHVLTGIIQKPLKDFLTENITNKIGMGEWTWDIEQEINRIPINNGCSGVNVNALQIARLGLLFLNRGKWNGEQLISENWCRAATSKQVDASVPVFQGDRKADRGSGSYGFNWWVNSADGLSRMPYAPLGTAYMSGFNHNVCCIVPEWNMVIVRLGSDLNPPDGKPVVWNTFLKLVGESIVKK